MNLLFTATMPLEMAYKWGVSRQRSAVSIIEISTIFRAYLPAES
jgi:hypothetical protein